jgi:hypothetical protein
MKMQFLRKKLLVMTAISSMCSANAVFSQENVGPLINEFMPSNTVTIADEDGDLPDWIELFNPGAAPIDLTGYGLSDDPDEPFKWIFPHGVIEPGQHRLVFASGKDRTNVPGHWETILAAGDEWRYFVGLEEPPADWRSAEFDDSSWLSGPSRFGYRDGDATVLPRKVNPSNQTSVYLRTTFAIADPDAVLRLFLHLDYEDGFVAYLNGSEVARSNIGEIGTPPPHDEIAAANSGKGPEAFDLEEVQALLVAGENTLAIQVHSLSAVHYLSALPLLTLGLKSAPAAARGIPDFLQFPTVSHTNFKIRSNGEPLFLTNSSGDLVDRIEGEQIPTDFSWGREPDGGEEWKIFPTPTPGASNLTEGFETFTGAVAIEPAAGFHRDGTEVQMSAAGPGTRIYYTLDGAEPADSVAMSLYTEPISVDSTTVVKARAYAPGMLPGPVTTRTYLVGRDFELPVMSLSTHPDHFFDDKIGIYVKGTNGTYERKRYNANYGEDWERPVHVEFFEADGTLGFSIDAGVKIIGLAGRTYPRKGMALFARSEYGYSEINYRIFPDLPIEEFTALVLRNSGRDLVDHSTLFRDELCQALVEDLDVDLMAYRPVIVYINGVYWGIHNLREKQNEEYLAAHQGVDPDEVDILELYHGSPPPIVIEGDAAHYNAMIDFMSANDLSQQDHFDYVATQMYMDHFVAYIAAEIYLGNIDWLGNNMKFWRPRTPDGKWRWMLFDIDWGLGRASGGVRHNTLEMATDPTGPGRYPAWTTFLIRQLFKNQSFVEAYANRSADQMNSIFLPDRVARTVEEMKSVLEPELAHHFARWGGNLENWNRNLREQALYAVERPPHLRQFIMEKFGISGTAEVELNIDQPGAGTIKLNTLDIAAFPWSGTYFQGVPIQVTALSNPGYRFEGWSGTISPNLASTAIDLEGDISLTARFVADNQYLNRIVINEINYNSPDDLDVEDWVELYNGYEVPVDVSGWVFNDGEDRRPYIIPGRTIIAPGGYLVLCRDTFQFRQAFPQVENYIGNFGFGLSRGGELIRLYNASGALVDSLSYDDESPWPLETDGEGSTLSLLSPHLDNSLPVSWGTSVIDGTPGRANEVRTVIEEVGGTVLPRTAALAQNYPNPFNSETVIAFSLPQADRVRIDLYSSLGQRVTTLVAAHLQAGNYRVAFTAENLAAGPYFYRMQAGEFVQTKQMMLLK